MGPKLKAEPVSKNHFFQVLQQTYKELYTLAAKRGWKICVPHSSTVSGATLNEHFFKSHILQSSPYFKEEYVTLNGQCVIYKNGVISTKTGFDSPRKVYVLGEELFYTESFKSFTVYSISAPLVGVQPLHGSPSTIPSTLNHPHHPSHRHKVHQYQHHGPYSNSAPSNRLRSASSSTSTSTHRHHHQHRLSSSSSTNINTATTTIQSPPSPLSMSNGHRHRTTSNGVHSESECMSTQIGLIPIEERTERHWQSLLSLSLDPVIYKKLMEETVSFSDQFNRSYVMIKGYTKSASQRIEEFRRNTFDHILNADPLSVSLHGNKSKSRSSLKSIKSRSQRHGHGLSGHKVDELQSAFDSYLNSILFDRVFRSFLIRQYKSEDVVFRKQLNMLRSLSQRAIGIKPQFENVGKFQSAVSHLVRINAMKTPKQKLGVLQQTMQRIRGCIEQQNEESKHSAKGHLNGHHVQRKEEMALTTDDMLSMFTFVLIHSEMEHIESENEYIQHFYFPLDCTAHLTYFAATLQASIQYCKEQLFQQKEVKPQRRRSTTKPPKMTNRFGRSRSEHHMKTHRDRKVNGSTNPFDI